MTKPIIVTANNHTYMLVQGTVKILTSKIYGKEITYGVAWTNTNYQYEIFSLVTPLEDSNIKNIGESWNIVGELRTRIYKEKSFGEERKTPFFIYVETLEWESKYDPKTVIEDLPF